MEGRRLTDQAKLDEIRRDRQAVYGDPRENHIGIAQAWAGLLQPFADDIKSGRPIPEHLVAMLLAAMKLNRMRRQFHEDNYDDIANYLRFAKTWQEDWAKAKAMAGPRVERIYIAGPYSSVSREAVDMNVTRAAYAAKCCMERGHDAHCPHTATHDIAAMAPHLGYEQWMRLDLGIIERWATALLYIGPSPGADRELKRAEELGLTIYRSVEEVPCLTTKTATPSTTAPALPATGPTTDNIPRTIKAIDTVIGEIGRLPMPFIN